MNQDCLFCKIIAGAIPARKIYEDDQAVAFEDINPQAPSHLLVIPRRHIPTLDALTPQDEPLVGHLATVAAKLARERGHADAGYRLVFNCNADAGQTVFHLHGHLLGGRKFTWPPG